MYLLDTNIVSEVRKVRPHGGVVAWLEETPPHLISLPAVVLAELQDGAEYLRPRDPARSADLETWIDRLQATMTILPADGGIFRCWSKLMVGRQSHLIEDALIAATAIVYGLTVVTRNVRDFEPFAVRVFNPFLP